MHVVFFCLYESGFLARERAQAHHRVDRSFKQCFFVKTIDFRSHIKLLACSLFCFAVCAFSKLLWGDACVCVCVVVHVLLILGPGNFCLVFLHHLLYIWIHMNIYIYTFEPCESCAFHLYSFYIIFRWSHVYLSHFCLEKIAFLFCSRFVFHSVFGVVMWTCVSMLYVVHCYCFSFSLSLSLFIVQFHFRFTRSQVLHFVVQTSTK